MGNSHWTLALGVLVISGGCLQGAGGDDLDTRVETEPIGSTSVATPGIDDHSSATGTIKGVVTDDELHPIAGATVSLKSLQAGLRTADDGAFAFMDVPAGRYTVEAQAMGYVGQAVRIHVAPDQDVDIRFALDAIPVQEPRIEVTHHATLIRAHVGPTSWLTSVIPNDCEPRCATFFALPDRPDIVMVEVNGSHSNPHPRGWDGLLVQARAYPANSSSFKLIRLCQGSIGDPNNECLRLPIVFDVDRTVLDDLERGTLERLWIELRCEESWMCVEDRYDTWISMFFDWEGEEIPPGYSAEPGG